MNSEREVGGMKKVTEYSWWHQQRKAGVISHKEFAQVSLDIEMNVRS